MKIGLIWRGVLCALTFTAFAASGEGSDWPQFRGMKGDGISPETELLASWPEDGPRQVWRRTLGPGFSGITVSDGRLYTMYAVTEPDTPEGEQPKGTEFVAAFNQIDGAELWRVPFGEQFNDNFGNGPRSSPAVDGDMIYALGSKGLFLALAASDGAIRWQVDFTKDFESPVPNRGFSNSPIVVGDMVLIQTGGGEGELFAGFDKKTGKRLWTSENGRPGYTTPVIADIDGVRHFISINNQTVFALGVNGDLLWSHPWPNSQEAIAMPIFIPPNMFFFSAAGAAGGLAIKVAKEGDAFKATQIWHNPHYRNHFSSSVLHEGHIYGFDNAMLKCISVKDGEQAWARRGFGKGSLIAADGKLFVLSDRGQLAMVEATPEKYVEISEFQALKGKSWTAPTLSGGRLYLRNHEEMVCYDLKSNEVQ